MTLKSYGAIAVMAVCFCVVYPRFMHPMFSKMLGYGETPRRSAEDEMTKLYPPGHKGRPAGPRGGVGPDDMRKHMKHGPHPGMRAAAEMQRQHAQQGSGRGMMGVVLPMYAVGIVLYLGYTLMKVFNKSNPKQNNRTNRASHNRYERDDGYSQERDRMGFPTDFNGSDSGVQNFLYNQEHRQNLEELLTRVDDKNVSADEMRVLQKRLEETEAQMTRILQAMRGINTNVDNLVAPENVVNGDRDEEETASSANDKKTDETKTDSENMETKETEEEKGPTKEKEDEGNIDNEDLEDDEADAKGDGEQDIVDEILKDKNDADVDNDENNATSVRQRNVKLNEQ